jgi:hypothetical protein
MMSVELVACRVPKDPTSPMQEGGYVMAYVVFYEREFRVP